MLDHIGLQVQDVEKSLGFYLSAFAPIGMHEVMRFPYGETIVVGLGGPDGQPGKRGRRPAWLGSQASRPSRHTQPVSSFR